jgi:superfamily II helicase
MSFNSLGLSDALLKAISKKGYTTPSPIQQKAIPPILEGKDVLASAQTGTGKTLKQQTYSCLNIDTHKRISCSNTCQYKRIR